MADVNDHKMTVSPVTSTFRIPGPGPIWLAKQALIGTHWSHLTVTPVDLSGKWILITGANNGIGRDAALQFAAWGASIILACRDPPPTEIHPEDVVKECYQKAVDAGYMSASFEWWQVDMADLSSVKALGKKWLATSRPLDILCNNAGMTERGKPVITKDGFDVVHVVNFLSHVLLTMTVLPSIAAAHAPRIICTTSNMQYHGIFDLSNANNGIRSYPNSKLYFQTWLTEFQHRCLQTHKYKHITINGVHPGYVKTGIWTESKKTKDRWAANILNFLLPYVGISSQQGSLAITHAATAPEAGPDPSIQGVGHIEGNGGGRFYSRTWTIDAMPQTHDPRARTALWKFVDEELRYTGLGSLAALD